MEKKGQANYKEPVEVMTGRPVIGKTAKYKSPYPLKKAYKGDSGLDILANCSPDVTIPSGEYKTIDTGLFIELPDGVDAEVRSRSGLASKLGIAVLNSPGTIDSGYRGEIKVSLLNHGKSDFTIKQGDKIAQLVFGEVLDIALVSGDKSNKQDNIEDRSYKGFGSSDPKPLT